MHQDDPLRKLYSQAAPIEYKQLDKHAPQIFVTLSAFKMPLSVFCRVLSDKYGVGLVYAESLASKEITAEFKKTDLESVFNVVSRQLALDVVRVGNTYYIGSLRPEDRGVYVKKVVGYDKDSLNSTVLSVLSSSGKATVSGNIVIIADHESVLRRVSELIEYLSLVDRPTWVIQLYFVILRKDSMLDAGLLTKSSGTVAYNISSQKLSFEDLALEGAFNMLNNSDYADLYAAPMFLSRDQVSCKWSDGERVPVPRKTVSEYGTVTTQGFDYIDTGLIVNVLCSESRLGGYLKLDLSVSEITGYVEYAPVTKQTLYTLESDMQENKLYLLGELNKFKVLDEQKQTFDFSRTSGKSVVQIWAKLYRVSGASLIEPVKPPEVKAN